MRQQRYQKPWYWRLTPLLLFTFVVMLVLIVGCTHSAMRDRCMAEGGTYERVWPNRYWTCTKNE